jgi:hypothetical protein
MEFNFSVEYKLDASNTVADALSRHEEGKVAELAALSAHNFMVLICALTWKRWPSYAS